MDCILVNSRREICSRYKCAPAHELCIDKVVLLVQNHNLWKKHETDFIKTTFDASVSRSVSRYHLSVK